MQRRIVFKIKKTSTLVDYFDENGARRESKAERKRENNRNRQTDRETSRQTYRQLNRHREIACLLLTIDGTCQWMRAKDFYGAQGTRERGRQWVWSIRNWHIFGWASERFIHLPQTNNRSWNRRAKHTHTQRTILTHMNARINKWICVEQGRGRKRVAWHCQWRRECHKQRHIFKSVQNANFRSLSKWKINSRQ